MSFLSDLYLVANKRNTIVVLFLLSLVLDAEMIASPLLLGHRLGPNGKWGEGANLAAIIIQISVFVGVTTFWSIMFYVSMRSMRSLFSRALWAVAFFLGIWWTAQLYYLFVYRRLSHQPSG